MTTCREVILLAAHTINEFIFSQYYVLKKAVEKRADLYLLLEGDESIKSLLPADVQSYVFSIDSLKELKYNPIGETLIPGNNHFPVFLFYRDFPNYDYYWNIEYDVYFHGDWCAFFTAFDGIDADFISSHIEYFGQRPSWNWWNTMNVKTLSIPQQEYIKSFNPIYRISNIALNYLNQVLSEGNSGHHEVFIPTILNNGGFLLLDYGGFGNFTPPEFNDRFYYVPYILDDYYADTTMRYRPLFDREKIEETSCNNKLYHPVKC